MKIATHQPDFLPYIGLFWKIYCCDVLVILDDVQYSKRGMHDFNYIKTPQGKYKLKVPEKTYLMGESAFRSDKGGEQHG